MINKTRTSFISLQLGFVAFISLFLGGCARSHYVLHHNPSEKQAPEEVVVLTHGFGKSSRSMRTMAEYLRGHDYTVYVLNYPTTSRSVEDVMEIFQQQLDSCCHLAKKVHFIGHSIGGLLNRFFIQNNSTENLGKVVLIGTPSRGSDIVERWGDNKLVNYFFGGIINKLGKGEDDLPAKIHHPHYPLGVIAGSKTHPLSGVFFPGEDDGAVTVKSTVAPGMADHMIVHTNHHGLRKHPEVLAQLVYFLDNGKFRRGPGHPPLIDPDLLYAEGSLNEEAGF
jgi:pimeloyl-ACP methyl ester carboxylesterase